MGPFDQWDYGFPIDIGFTWKGRKGVHILTSGLDDYPRSEPVHDGDLHVDLLCWMIQFTRTLKAVAQDLSLSDDIAFFSKKDEKMTRTLESI